MARTVKSAEPRVVSALIAGCEGADDKDRQRYREQAELRPVGRRQRLSDFPTLRLFMAPLSPCDTIKAHKS